jgi:RhtB (resistance to homoserine/threonine) family protein
MLLSIAVVHLLAVMSPGANFLIVTHNSLAYSRRFGLVTARGVAVGSLIYVVIGFLGFAALIAGSTLVFNGIKLVGALYFFYVGYKTLRSLRKSNDGENHDSSMLTDFSAQRAFWTGFVTALSNPASALYFLALFTTFIPPAVPFTEKLLIACLLITISFLWYTVIAFTFSDARVRGWYRRFERPMNVLMGMVWIFLGLRLLGLV